MPNGVTLKNVTLGAHKYRVLDKMDNDANVFDGEVAAGQLSQAFNLAPDVDGSGSVSVEVSGMTGKAFSQIADGAVLSVD